MEYVVPVWPFSTCAKRFPQSVNSRAGREFLPIYLLSDLFDSSSHARPALPRESLVGLCLESSGYFAARYLRLRRLYREKRLAGTHDTALGRKVGIIHRPP